MAAAIMGVKDISLWIVNITTNAGLLVKNLHRYSSTLRQKVFLNHDIPQWKCTINPIRHQNYNGKVIDRIWTCFSS